MKSSAFFLSNRRIGPGWIGLIFLLVCPLAWPAEISTEYKVKAAFLYNFTKFVEWPSDRFPDGQAPVVIAVLGRSPFSDELAKAVAGRQVGGRALVIRSIGTIEEARDAHLLFVPAGEEKLFATMADSLRAAPVLLVGESQELAALGGVILFVRESDKVRFAIDLQAGEARRLRISAQLLKLAVTVHRKS
jgi:hypothetical protein